MIEREEILKGQKIDESLEGNLEKLLTALNRFREVWGKPMIVTSGYRSPAHNALVGGAKRSNHMKCLAGDFAAPDESLDVFCQTNLKLLEDCGLWLESPTHTKGWCHLQVVPPKSGKRIFIP